MNLICRPYVGSYRQRTDIGKLMDAGFTTSMLDVSMICSPCEFDDLRRKNYKREPDKVYLTEQPDKLIEEVTKWLVKPSEECGLPLPVAMAPYLPYKRPEWRIGSEVNETLKVLAVETLKAAIQARCHSVIVHPLSVGIDRGSEWEVNKGFYHKLAMVADELESDIQILLVNMGNNINGHIVRGICAQPEESCGWVDRLNEEYSSGDERRFGFCFDLGTATMSGQDPYETIAPLGHRLKAVVVRDCDGIHDAAMLPYTACVQGQQTDWLSFIRGVRSVDFDDDLILDFSDTYYGFIEMLRPQLLKLAFETGDLMCRHIGIERVVKKHKSRVLFGAGNMCRAYMKCYGDEYPPLFACDNNSSRWGEEFCGLRIESPEKLKDLSPDTAIFLCNIYYKEIGEQLEAMNLPNPIEWFSDEYMPAFHMDRLPMAVVTDGGNVTQGKLFIKNQAGGAS